MAILDYYGSVQGYVEFWCVKDFTDLSAAEIAIIENTLEMAASDINTAIISVGADTCTYSATALKLLERFNYMAAAVTYNCPCANPRLTDADKRLYTEWLQGIIKNIMDNTLELCQGETGSMFPSVDAAEQSVTIWGPSRVIWNTERRNS